MIKSPKKKNDKKESVKLCECRPICKNRRRIWKGKTLYTSAELLAEKERQKERPPDYTTVTPQSRPSDDWLKPPGTPVNTRKSSSIKICKTHVAETAPTPCLQFADLAKRLGAWSSVKSKCAFCACYACCLCSSKGYALADESSEHRRCTMRDFDQRVKSDCKIMRIMYDKI
ncbi:uncharacterized protein [Battus philenor]|uniref:uncharacterized protein n=1 Tax=Battus philenor TaxID=42288 RepID=UPI0035D11F3D